VARGAAATASLTISEMRTVAALIRYAVENQLVS
jgi:hypothetical protein